MLIHMTQDEKEKEAAEEALRTNNATLTTKVRSLEVAAERSDTEHVQVCFPRLAHLDACANIC